MRKDHLKQRLAYSTVSQLSYIVLGLAILSPDAIRGGLLHIPAHAFMKLTLFFCAGIIHVETHTDHISEMAGIGKRMPVTMGAFAVAAAGMAGIPLVAGFVSKFYLLVGAVSAGGTVFAVALLLSGVLNIAYFWPVVYQAYFESEADQDAKPLVESPLGGRTVSALARADGGAPEDGPDGSPDEDSTTDEDDDLDVDPEKVGRPDFSGESVERDYSEPAPLVDGEYAVDRHPSDHAIPEEESDEEPGDASDEADGHHDTVEHHADDHHADDHHHEGPPPGGWDRRGWLGQESTWFMLGPILAAMTGSVVLGLVPYGAVFLRLIDAIVSAALTTGVVG